MIKFTIIIGITQKWMSLECVLRKPSQIFQMSDGIKAKMIKIKHTVLSLGSPHLLILLWLNSL